METPNGPNEKNSHNSPDPNTKPKNFHSESDHAGANNKKKKLTLVGTLLVIVLIVIISWSQAKPKEKYKQNVATNEEYQYSLKTTEVPVEWLDDFITNEMKAGNAITGAIGVKNIQEKKKSEETTLDVDDKSFNCEYYKAKLILQPEKYYTYGKNGKHEHYRECYSKSAWYFIYEVSDDPVVVVTEVFVKGAAGVKDLNKIVQENCTTQKIEEAKHKRSSEFKLENDNVIVLDEVYTKIGSDKAYWNGDKFITNHTAATDTKDQGELAVIPGITDYLNQPLDYIEWDADHLRYTFGDDNYSTINVTLAFSFVKEIPSDINLAEHVQEGTTYFVQTPNTNHKQALYCECKNGYFEIVISEEYNSQNSEDLTEELLELASQITFVSDHFETVQAAGPLAKREMMLEANSGNNLIKIYHSAGKGKWKKDSIEELGISNEFFTEMNIGGGASNTSDQSGAAFQQLWDEAMENAIKRNTRSDFLEQNHYESTVDYLGSLSDSSMLSESNVKSQISQENRKQTQDQSPSTGVNSYKINYYFTDSFGRTTGLSSSLSLKSASNSKWSLCRCFNCETLLATELYTVNCTLNGINCLEYSQDEIEKIVHSIYDNLEIIIEENDVEYDSLGTAFPTSILDNENWNIECQRVYVDTPGNVHACFKIENRSESSKIVRICNKSINGYQLGDTVTLEIAPAVYEYDYILRKEDLEPYHFASYDEIIYSFMLNCQDTINDYGAFYECEDEQEYSVELKSNSKKTEISTNEKWAIDGKQIVLIDDNQFYLAYALNKNTDLQKRYAYRMYLFAENKTAETVRIVTSVHINDKTTGNIGAFYLAPGNKTIAKASLYDTYFTDDQKASIELLYDGIAIRYSIVSRDGKHIYMDNIK